MFDLRYHVASLAAVFLALVLGILIGAAIADPGLADKTSKDKLREQIGRLERRLEDAELRASAGDAAQSFSAAAYRALMAERLAGRRVLVVSVGPADERTEQVMTAIRDAGGTVVRMRALQLPPDALGVERSLAERPALRRYVGRERIGDVGRDLGRELVQGGRDAPLLAALSDILVQQRTGKDGGPPVDGVVVVRSAQPQRGAIGRLVAGLYEGLATADAAVGADVSSAAAPAVPAFERGGLSTVDSVDLVPGKVALAVLLAGGERGSYGLNARRLVPPIDPVTAAPAGG